MADIWTWHKSDADESKRTISVGEIDIVADGSFGATIHITKDMGKLREFEVQLHQSEARKLRDQLNEILGEE